jgi:hypothetical protein
VTWPSADRARVSMRSKLIGRGAETVGEAASLIAS